MEYRQFYITNGKNVTKYLATPSSKIMMNEPAGLGYSFALTNYQYEDSVVATKEQNFGTIGGEIIFFDDSLGDKYSKYNDFVTFLMDKPLTLFYTIPTSPAKTYSMIVEDAQLDKTEVKTNGGLRCAVSFQSLSRWMGSKVTVTGATTSYTITNDGHMPVGFEITVSGSGMINPYITLSQNSELYGEAKFVDTTGFDSVYINSNDGKQEVQLEQNGSVVANPLGFQDMSISNGAIYVTFIKIARGTSTLEVGLDSGLITSVNIQYVPLYRSV